MNEMIENIKILIRQCEIEIEDCKNLGWMSTVLIRQGMITAYQNVINMLNAFNKQENENENHN